MLTHCNEQWNATERQNKSCHDVLGLAAVRQWLSVYTA